MNTIPSSKVLDKISELAAKAKIAQTKEQQIGYILAMKALCEILEQETVTANYSSVADLSIKADAADRQSEQKMKFEDANGTSLLDF